MTAPRQRLPGATYLVTRRCFQRRYFLRPSKQVNEVFRFVLAVAAERHHIRLHAYCVLSNHYHLVLTDPDAALPDFMRDLNALVARALNASVGRWEDFWSASGYSAVALLSPADVLDKAAYTLANPVAAGLVRAGRQWPGLWSAPETIGAPPVEVRRPTHFFDPEGALPERAVLQLSTPSGFGSSAAFQRDLTAAVLEREAEAARRTTRFLGILKVLGQDPLGRPRDREPRRGPSPRVACRDMWRRIEALTRLRDFEVAYRAALEAWRQDRSVVFPAGTYLMRVLHGAACEGFA